VSWTTPNDNGSPITGYTIDWSSFPSLSTGSQPCAGSPCTVTGLTNGTGYTFTVTATNAKGTGLASLPSSAVPGSVPGVPTNVSATAGNAQATLTWTAPSSDGGPINGYWVDWSTGSQPCAGSPCTITGLTNGTSYSFTVTATNGVGTGPASTASNTVTPAGLPGAPTGVSAVAGDGQALVSWTAPGNNGSAITGYTVSWSGGNQACTASPCTVSGLSNGTPYSFTVTATNAIGTGPSSAASNVVTPGPTVPDAPTGVNATAGNAQATLTWTAPAANGSPITGYTVSWSGGSQPCAGSPCTITRLTNGTSYTFTVTATNAAGVGPSSAPSNVVTPALPTVSSVVPNIGPTTGGTSVTISGTNFTSVTAIKFGTTAATTYTVNNATQISATSPVATAGTVDVTVTTGGGTSATSSADKFTFEAPGGVYTAVTPVRLLDTRNTGTTLGSGGSLNLQIAGVNGVPAGATAVVVNVTAVDESAGGFFTVYPTGLSRPLASNLNFSAHETVPNLVTVGLGGGSITIYNGVGTANAVVDLEGYYAPSGGGTAGEYVPVVPARITDTRPGSGKPNAGMTLGQGAILNVQVTSAGGIPSTGVSAVVMNVTATNTSAASFFTVYPTGQTRPLASNLNWTAGVTVPNRVIVPVGSGGQVSFYNGVGSADLIVDVNGYFTDSTLAGASFTALTPARLVDTRNGTGGFNSPLGQGASMVVTVAGNGGVPMMASATPPSAVVLNVTVDGPSAASDLVVWPDGASAPVASDLNFVPGQTVPNLVIVKLSAGGKIDIRNDFGSTSVIIDVVGWYG